MTKNLVVENRKENTALKVGKFAHIEDFKAWKQAVESLRLILSECVKVNREGMSEKEVKEAKNKVFPAYKEVLAFFTDIDGRVKPQDSDFNSLLTICTAERKAYKGEYKECLPVSTNTFRKNVENFIADRIASASCKTAQQIEAERKARREAKKAERKRLREEQKAKENKAKIKSNKAA